MHSERVSTTGVKNGTLEHFVHVLHLCRVGAGDEGRSAGDKLCHGIDRAINGSPGIGLGLASNGSGWRGLVFGEAVDEIVHDDVGKIDVLPGGVVEVVAPDGESVAVTTKHENVEVRTREGDAGCKRKGTTVNEVDAVGIHEVWEARRATDTGNDTNFFVGNAELLDDVEEGRENCEISASRTPGWVVGFELLFSQFFSGGGGGSVGHDESVVKMNSE